MRKKKSLFDVCIKICYEETFFIQRNTFNYNIRSNNFLTCNISVRSLEYLSRAILIPHLPKIFLRCMQIRIKRKKKKGKTKGKGK